MQPMRSIRAAAFALVLCLAASPSAAEGALALGLPASVADDGVAFGWAVDFASAETAAAEALKFCRDAKEAPESTRALCKVVQNFRSQCVAVALDPEDGTPGFGWAIAPVQEAAETQAQNACIATAGAERRDRCEIAVSRCDGR